MAERGAKASLQGRPLPMKLFADWEIDRTPSNCIPRLCQLTLTRLVILRPLGADLASVFIAVKMQSSKRTLRSTELAVPPGGLFDTELELQFALQYPHFIKREGNKLLVLLQRRKRYKNRTMLGYKTLAEGVINMAQVLQKQMDLELELVSDKAEKYGGHALARVNVIALSSQPVDHDKRLMNDPTERLCQEFSDEEEEFSSEAEAEGSDSEPTLEVRRRKSRTKIPGNARQRNLKQKFIALLKRFRVSEDLEHDQGEIEQKLTGGDMEIEDLFDELEDLSDSGPELDTMSVSSTPKPSLRPFFSSSKSLLAPPHSLVSSEENGVGNSTLAAVVASNSTTTAAASSAPGQPIKERSRVGHTTPERGVDRASDDSSRRNDSDSHPDNWTDHEAGEHTTSGQQQQQLNNSHGNASGSPPRPHSEHKDKDKGDERKSKLFAKDQAKKAKKHSLSVELKPAGDAINAEPRKALVEQLGRVLPDDYLPESISLVSLSDPGGAVLAARLQERNLRVLTTASPADVRATFSCLVARLQKFCNTSAKPPTPIRVVIAGGDGFVNAVLRQYVELLSFRPPDWQSYLRFLVVPLGVNGLSRYLSSLDSRYSVLFGPPDEILGLTDSLSNDNASRVCEYLSSCANTLLLPIAEAMVTYRDTDDSGQIFVPFVNDVRVGCLEVNTSASVELDEAGCAMVGFTGGTSSSTMASASFAGVSSGGFTGANSGSSPPSAQTTSGSNLPLSATSSAPSGSRLTPPSSPNVGQPREVGVWEQQPVELQLDYWGKPAQAGEKAKNSIRQAFRVLHVQRLPPLGEPPSQSLFISYMTKEKKQKIMRLGKKKEKEKESEPKSQQVDGVTRLICSAKTHNIPLRVSIDGTDWHGVKFFQLSAQWQTHIKTFPIAMPSYSSPGQPQPPSSLS